ncbi:ESD, partial [Symbiodinium microadriaticum]
MTCAVYLPPSQSDSKFPSLMYLSGLTCTDENVCQKGAAFRSLAENQIAFICPDTSPRNVGVPGEDDSWDFGTGAGFYLDATESPWSQNYRMYSYVTQELPEVIASNFPQIDVNTMSITGHSMGGHGALTIALKNPDRFRSVSAFAPICNPTNCPWGVKAFSGYLGADQTAWREFDTCELLRSRGASSYTDILIDVGLADGFLENQLKPDALQEVCDNVDQRVSI